jgi:hypothetical protein
MTYSPKKTIEEEQEEIEIKVSKRIDELLASIKQVGSMYVEPGDVVLVQVDKDTTNEMMANLQKMLSKVFKDNKGIFTTDNIEFKVIKKGESDGQQSKEIEDLKKEVEQLKTQLQNLQGFVSKHTPV